jgi:hypothetical protein
MPGMCGGHHGPRGNLRSTWRNFRDSDLPLLSRVRVTAANEWWKVRHRRRCCGHYGQPGC